MESKYFYAIEMFVSFNSSKYSRYTYIARTFYKYNIPSTIKRNTKK